MSPKSNEKIMKGMVTQIVAIAKKHNQEIKSILSPEEFAEYQKENKKKGDLRLAGEQTKKEIQKLEIKARKDVRKFISRYSNKKFQVSKEFYDYAIDRLYDTFRWSKEFPIVGGFKLENNEMVMTRFLDSKFLIKNGYAESLTSSGMIQRDKTGKIMDYSFTPMISWYTEKLRRLETEFRKTGEYLIRLHTHPGHVYPSEGDIKVSYVMGLVGFEKSNDELNRLLENSFVSAFGGIKNNPRWKKVRRSTKYIIERIEKSNLPSWEKKIEIYMTKKYSPKGETWEYLQPYKIGKRKWNRICSECNPTIKLFAGYANRKAKSIPLYLNGRAL